MTGDLVIRGGSVVTPSGRVEGDVVVVNGRIASVGVPAPSSTGTIVDADGLVVAPGFVELQVNGGWGTDVTSDPPSMWPLAEQLLTRGVSSFLPTVVTSSPDAVIGAQRALRDRPGSLIGARALGLHLEGPMINPVRRGAHPASHIAPADLDLAAEWSAASGIAMVTLAPELPGALDVIRALVDRGVVVSGGHSDATVEEAEAAIDAGMSHLTHLFNAMAPITHRAPGIAGVGLARADVTVGLVVDGLHLHPTTVAAVRNAKGAQGLVLVSDASSAMGRPPGTHRLGDTTITVDETGIRTADGVLAGSAIGIDDGVRNLVAFTGCAVDDAITSASTTPATVIGATSTGRIEPGLVADLVLLDDLAPVCTIVDGAVAWTR
ncbi:MAG: N-acetylglucosamine-6-phosphate deacetylase [Actinomycetota bacterium]